MVNVRPDTRRVAVIPVVAHVPDNAVKALPNAETGVPTSVEQLTKTLNEERLA